jgi:O-antigen ligase
MLADLVVILLVSPLTADEPYEVTRAAGTLGALTLVGLWVAWCWVRGGVIVRPSRAYVPMALLLASVLLQLLPVGMPALARLSPKTAELRQQTASALGDLAPAASGLSLNPNATADELMLLTSGLLVFWAVFNGPDDPRHLRHLCLLMVAVGCAIACLTLLEHFIIDDNAEMLGAATFDNHNRFAGYLNACIGAGLGLILESAAHRVSPLPTPPTVGAGDDVEGRPPWPGWLVLMVPAVGVMAGAVMLSLSRGGSLALLGALTVALGMLLWKRKTRRLALFPGVAAILAVLLIVGFGGEPVLNRLMSLTNPEAVEGSRFRLWKDSLQAVPDFPVFGIGLGCYQTVFPMYKTQHLIPGLTYTHAENEYLQVLVELGAVGALFAGMLLILVLNAVRHAVRDAPRRNWLAAGLAFSTVAVLIQSGADFGFHGAGTPYLYILVVSMCLQQGAKAHAVRAGKPLRSHLLPGGRGMVAVCGFAITAMAAWMLGEERRSVRVAHHLDAFDQCLAAERTSIESRGDCEGHLLAAAAERPWDTNLQTEIGAYFLGHTPGGTQGRAHLVRAVSACPVNGDAHLLLGDWYDGAADPRAGPHLALGARLRSSGPHVHGHYGHWLMSQGHYEAALSAYVEAAARDTSYVNEVLRVLTMLTGDRPEPLGRTDDMKPVAVRQALAALLRRHGRTAQAARLESIGPLEWVRE